MPHGEEWKGIQIKSSRAESSRVEWLRKPASLSPLRGHELNGILCGFLCGCHEETKVLRREDTKGAADDQSKGTADDQTPPPTPPPV